MAKFRHDVGHHIDPNVFQRGFRQRQSLYGQDLVAGSVSQQDRRP